MESYTDSSLRKKKVAFTAVLQLMLVSPRLHRCQTGKTIKVEHAAKTVRLLKETLIDLYVVPGEFSLVFIYLEVCTYFTSIGVP